MPKPDCKYWDKCYQKNEYHLQKYNHPVKDKSEETKGGREDNQKAAETQQQQQKQQQVQQQSEEKQAPKRDTDGKQKMDSNSTDEVVVAPELPPVNDDVEHQKLHEEVLGNIAGKNYMEILRKRIKLAVQAEYDELLRSNEFIRHKFLVEMPPDFYAFWKFACELRKEATGDELLRHVEKQFQLQLVGPFEFLAGRFHNATIREPGDYLRHWRFYYDVPEFQTIFVKPGTGIHYGYWRDTPQDKDNLLIARNDAAKGCEFEFVAGNAFDAFLYYLEKDFVSSPFSASLLASTKKSLQKFLVENEVNVEKLEPLRKARNLNVVAKTFHRAGIVVPYDRKSQQGYRPLMVTDAELKKILKLFEHKSSDAKDDTVKAAVTEKLTPIATAANIAVDECDFGTALELGIDLFSSGHKELHMLVQSLLVPAYSLLQRPQFIAISKAHMEKRSKSHKNLSIFELDKEEQMEATNTKHT